MNIVYKKRMKGLDVLAIHQANELEPENIKKL